MIERTVPVEALLAKVAMQLGGRERSLYLHDEFLLEALSELKKVGHLRSFVIGFEHPKWDKVGLLQKLAYLAALPLDEVEDEVAQAIAHALSRR